MTAPTETGPSWSRGTNPETPAVVPSPADMPPTQPPVAAAPTTETSELVKPAEVKPEGEENSELAKVRREAAKYRTERNEFKTNAETAAAAVAAAEKQRDELTAILAGINKALNPGVDETPDPAKLTEQLTAAQAETARVAAEKDQTIRNLTIRAALPSVLSKASADPSLTEAVLTANGALAKLDPSSDSFAADLASAVAAAMENNPRLKVAPVASRSGAEIPGRSGGSDQLTIEQVRAMKPEQVDEARKAGRLRSLLGG